MEVVVVERPDDAVPIVADAVTSLLQAKPDAVLGLATGSTPLPLYRELIRRHREQGLSFARARAFLLDEYVGLPPDHPERYRNVIERDFAGQVDLAPDAVRGPDGGAADLTAAAAAYEQAIAQAGGIDLQVLGLGSDGHLAFNMPTSSLASRTRITTLTATTRRANARFFDGDPDAVPQHCLTQGLGTILASRHAVLLAFGAAKAAAVAACVEGPVAARWPASVLQLHPHATVVVDAEAAHLLQLRDYYRDTWAGKPFWQGI
jgi:glucosamine-6-phosphate isomerase